MQTRMHKPRPLARPLPLSAVRGLETASSGLTAFGNYHYSNTPLQRRESARSPVANATGMPDQLKQGIEALSGVQLDQVRVHRNSTVPARFGAEAIAQGNQIHLAARQEQHLPHEAWHLVQQAQGRVKPTASVQGQAINDNPGLEHEADVMGARAQMMPTAPAAANVHNFAPVNLAAPRIAQGGGNKWAEHSNRELMEYRGSAGGGHIYLTREKNKPRSMYVEIWGKGEYLGGVNIVVNGDGSLALHTTSVEGKAGGLALAMFPEALKVIREGKAGDVNEIRMTPAPGAASKKVIEMLSAKFGNQEIHKMAEKERLKRLKSGKKRDPNLGLNDWDPDIDEEHLYHLLALQYEQPEGLSLMSGGGFITGPGVKDLPEQPEDKIKRIKRKREAGIDAEGGYGIELTGAALERMLEG